MGVRLGLSNKKRRAPAPQPVLSRAYATARNKRMPAPGRLTQLANEAKLSQRDVERWWRQQLVFTQPTKLFKFKEAMWRCIYYTFTTIAGFYMLWDKPWFSDVKQSWQPCGLYDMPRDVVLMYWVQLGMYFSLLITQFQDVRRKDFTEVSQLSQHNFPAFQERARKRGRAHVKREGNQFSQG